MHAELEEWDDTTDLIVWLIETSEEYHLSCPELTLDENPEHRYSRGSYETLESQKAWLEGWSKEHHKEQITFHVKQIMIKKPTSEELDAEVDGYEVIVEKRAADFKKYQISKFQVEGYDRKTFRRI